MKEWQKEQEQRRQTVLESQHGRRRTNDLCLFVTSIRAESCVFDGAEEMSDLPERRSADLWELVYRHGATFYDAAKASETDVSCVLRHLAVMQGCLAGHGEMKT